MKEKRPVAVFDFDGSVYRSNLLVDLVDQLVIDGIFPGKIKRQFDQEYNHWRAQRDREPYVEYMDKLVAAYIHHVTGNSKEEVQHAVEAVLEDANQKMYRFTRELLSQIKDSHFLLAISGSPLDIVGPYARSLGFDDEMGSTYELDENGIYTGNAKAGHRQKNKTLLAKVDQHNLTYVGSIGVGDTDSDIPMLQLVERPIAFNPNKELFEYALHNGWELIEERKDMILHIQGGTFQKENNFGHYYSDPDIA